MVVLLFGYHASTAGTLGRHVPVGPRGPAPAAPARRTAADATQLRHTARSSATASTTVTGAVAQTRWGPVQVQLTVSGGKITDVDVLQYPDGNGRDAEINDYALPILVQETISTPRAPSIDMVSGATVTSTGYIQSLQSALDQAGL